MNNISLMGRAVRDPEIRYSQGEKSVAYGSYTLAVDRPWRKDKEKETDFILCKVVGKSAEFAEKYIRQGMKMVVTGAMQIDNYTDKDGNKTVLKEDYIKYDYPSYSNSTTYVEEGTVFVLGDNRSHSGDSRLSSIGLVDTRRILGKVVLRVTPFSRFGAVD